MSRVLPWSTLGVGGVLTEAVREPWVTLEVLLEPVDVFDFHLGCGNGSRSHFKDLVGLLSELMEFLTLLIIEDGLAVDLVVGGVELGRHFFLFFIKKWFR